MAKATSTQSTAQDAASTLEAPPTTTTPQVAQITTTTPISFSSSNRASSRPRPSPAATAHAATKANDPSTQRLLDHPVSEDEYDEDDDLIIHAGRASEGDALPGLDPDTPRTPSRVRFNLQPEVAPPPRKSGETEGTTSASTSRDSLDFDDDPMYAPWHQPGGGGTGGDGDEDSQHRRPLLTAMEAPAVTLANTLGGMSDVEVAERLDREHNRPRSGMKSAFMNMANSIIGAGIIGQPYAFRQAGMLAGIVLLVGLTILVDWTICLIVVNSKLSGRDSFQGTVEHCFGRKGLIAISIAQWAFAFGGMVAFGVIIGDSIPHVMSALFPNLGKIPVLGMLVDRRAVIVIFIMGISFPLTLYRDIAKLAKASTLALISMMVILFTVIIQGSMVPREDRGNFNTPTLTVNNGIFQAIGVISFAFVCHHNSLLIYGSLKTPTIDRFSKVTHYSTGISMFACLIMALAGFLTFGDKTLGNVLNNFPPDNTMVNVARLCFGLNMLTTMPLEAFVCREVMLEFWYRDKPFNLKIHVLFSTGLIAGAVAISLITCDLGVVFELVGATSASVLAYILPTLCYMKLSTRSWRTFLAGGIVVFGFVVMGISITQAVMNLINGNGESVQCV
ncbi:Transmembrane amino acid transporter family protein [Zalerion maritima]|uniref:Transmembrane amino acid transporter family protein n=1 Tax=Zalerion maritima TaxID=339359 RepID=A0AAD5RX35_9PEZI|nr:Transmembrane amino acid transporter family protein [Zalerion maritima]